MWTKIGLAAAVLVSFTAPKAFHAGRTDIARPFPADISRAQPAIDKRFTAICKANAVTDTRPDPAWLGESFEDDRCRAPRMPAALDGYTATRGQIVAGMTAAKIYAAQADGFQKCVGNFLTARRAQGDRQGKPSGGVLAAIESHRIAVSEKNKQRAAAQIDVAINAFNEYGSECPDH